MRTTDNDPPGMPFLPPSPALADFIEEHRKLCAALKRFNPALLIPMIGGLLTMPEWQASTVRLEVLQHLATAFASGTKKPKGADLKSWLTELGNGKAGRMEDPSEDVFVSRVILPDRDCLIFEGIWESSAFLLQRFVNVLERMPNREPFIGLRRSACALLCLSDAVAVRAGVVAFEVGEVLPLQSVPNKLLRNLKELGDRVTFSQADLASLDIDLKDLSPFIFDPAERERIRDEALSYTTLERFPLVLIGDRLHLALPTAVTISVRRMVIEFCLATNLAEPLYASCAKEFAATFAGIPMLGGSTAPPLPFQKREGIYVASLARYIDEGRLLHLCFVVDGFDAYIETGTAGINPDISPIGKAVDSSIVEVHKSFSSRPDFREGLTLLVLCSWGRPVVLGFNGVEDERWRVETISAADFEALSWEPTFSPLELWRLLDARDRLQETNVELLNLNGLLNLYAWSEHLKGHLVPHEQMPDDHDPERPFKIYIPQNGLLSVRKKGIESWNLHHARTWDGRNVRVRRETANSLFDEDANAPLYVSMDDLENGTLLAVFETEKRAWWAKIETPNTPERDPHYRLWHTVTVWLKRAAPILENAMPALPQGALLWVCRFEDSDPTNPQFPIPSRAEANALLDVNAEGNVITVTARVGFLASFRNATNIGESLLVESLIAGALRLSGMEPTAEKIDVLAKQIVPDEWARDMHMFSDARFRNYVRAAIPHTPILINKSDDAYTRIGLGWRTRARSEGSRIIGVDACCDYLRKVIDSLWDEIATLLRQYNRESLLMQLIGNHEVVMLDSERWLRTARSILSLHDNKEEAAATSANQIAKYNASSLSTRILIEMALCECPETGGAEAGHLDIARLLANVMHIHYMGGWSEAIKYGIKVAEIRVAPLGDIHTHVDFDDNIARRYGEALAIRRFRQGASRYEKNYLEGEIVESARAGFPAEFWDAWLEAFGFTIDDLRVLLDALENRGISHETFAFTSTLTGICEFEGIATLAPETVRKIVDALTLKPRKTWASTPEGFAAKDWYPWRFRRRLSLICRPIIQLNDSRDPRYLIAPGMVRDGGIKVMEYCFEGGFEAKDFAGGMRSWIGAAENKRGHEFNEEVSKRLQELGWHTKTNVKLTEILNTKLDRDYGDVDVLAWRGGRVLAIECKELQMAMTISEIAHQLNDFRGEIGAAGKPDRLKKHLLRVDILKARLPAIQKYVRTSYEVTLEAMLVFSQLVPMHFSEIATHHDVRLATFGELENL